MCSCRSCLSLVGSPERRKIFLLLLSRLLSITHTHTRTLDDAEIKRDSRQSVPSPSLCSRVFARNEKKSGVLLSLVCSKLDFRIFFVQQFVQSRVKLKTEESSTACVNVYKLLRRELKECCYSLLKMIMVINARVFIFFCYFCALSSSLLRSAFPFLMHFDEIRVLVFFFFFLFFFFQFTLSPNTCCNRQRTFLHNRSCYLTPVGRE